LLFSVLAMGLLFGVVGLFVAAPLTVVLFVLVNKLYVQDTLGEAAEIPGER
jgi:predicted PurR-regulated permease PerM